MIVQTGDPLVSMIVLSYNQSRFVLETLESVRAQTYKATQLIIVDDCSSDSSVATIDRWLNESAIDCTFIRHRENQGICKSLNDALAVATGKYISAVASDDVWLPNKIAQQVEMMESQPDHVGIVYSDAFQMDENGHPLADMFIAAHRTLPEMPQGQILNILLEGNFIPAMTTLIRRSCYDKVGLYDENLPWEDWDMWMRLARHYSFIYSPTPSARYRYHKNSLTHSDPRRMIKDSFKICLKQIDSLNEEQKSRLIPILLNSSEYHYRTNDTEASDMLLGLWRATGNKKARWMYRFIKFGISHRNWQKAHAYFLRIRSLVP
jgi:glycosyltransferase involved in cell wall biosynthesis